MRVVGLQVVQRVVLLVLLLLLLLLLCGMILVLHERCQFGLTQRIVHKLCHRTPNHKRERSIGRWTAGEVRGRCVSRLLRRESGFPTD